MVEMGGRGRKDKMIQWKINVCLQLVTGIDVCMFERFYVPTCIYFDFLIY